MKLFFILILIFNLNFSFSKEEKEKFTNSFNNDIDRAIEFINNHKDSF